MGKPGLARRCGAAVGCFACSGRSSWRGYCSCARAPPPAPARCRWTGSTSCTGSRSRTPRGSPTTSGSCRRRRTRSWYSVRPSPPGNGASQCPAAPAAPIRRCRSMAIGNDRASTWAAATTRSRSKPRSRWRSTAATATTGSRSGRASSLRSPGGRRRHPRRRRLGRPRRRPRQRPAQRRRGVEPVRRHRHRPAHRLAAERRARRRGRSRRAGRGRRATAARTSHRSTRATRSRAARDPARRDLEGQLLLGGPLRSAAELPDEDARALAGLLGRRLQGVRVLRRRALPRREARLPARAEPPAVRLRR